MSCRGFAFPLVQKTIFIVETMFFGSNSREVRPTGKGNLTITRFGGPSVGYDGFSVHSSIHRTPNAFGLRSQPIIL